MRSQRRARVGERAVAALTLFCFTITTISPSLAWATEGQDLEPSARVVDEVKSGDVEAGHAEAESVAAAAEKVEAEKGFPSKEQLHDAAADAVEKTPAIDAQVQSDDAQTLALPTGADKSGVTSQSISVPKGSGTIQGMGESFSAQLSTGIATFSVPFALPAARGGAQPSLGLSYSSASGAGLAGMGWSVGVPFIARQTDRGLPGHKDQSRWHGNQDRFVFNGGQELVPICTIEGSGTSPSCAGAIAGEQFPGWSLGSQYFRARVEGSFLRFFWSADRLTWRVQDKSGVTMELGVPLDGRTTDADHRSGIEVNPDSTSQIHRWHLVRQYDTYGATPTATNPLDPATSPKPFNVVVYKYSQDGGQAYLSDIYDTTPTATPDTTDVTKFAHHTHLEYGLRTDPTESYRTGWLVKQTKRLERVDVASKTFSDGPSSARRLVRRYRLEYDDMFHISYLTSVQVEGRCDGSEGGEAVPEESNERLGGSSCDKLPPMTFQYSHVQGYSTAATAVGSGLAGYEAFDARLRAVSGDPRHSVDEEQTDFFDINSDGLPDVLVTAPGVYGNDFGVFFNSEGGTRQAFGKVARLGVKGVLGANSGSIKLSNPNVARLDLDGDGTIDFLHMPKVKTYSVYTPRQTNGKWMLDGRTIDASSKQNPKIDLGQDADETRVLDVNFDGMVDVVVSTGTEFQTFLSLGRLPGGDAQFGHGSWTSKDTAVLSNDPISKCVPYSGLPVHFSDSDIQLADMNGDGIQDIVRVRQGDFRYWPGRGNGYWGTGKLDDCPAGTFGDKRYVMMTDGPNYSDTQGTSLRMDDVNGDGLDDLVQIRFNDVDVWLNVDGKGWTQRHVIDGTPESPSYANPVRLMDINGSGTRDIVWGNGDTYQFMDLCGGERPGLLIGVTNGLGKSTSVEYTSSTEEMLAAERTGVSCAAGTTFERAWCSKMPTVTHVVKRVTESDNLSVAGSGIGAYVTEYSYQDPVYEGRQREFRGFRHAKSKRIGDANSPTDFTESTFLLGECTDETDDNVDDCERWRDNPNEALKGLPVVTERYDEQGVYLSTEATTYRLRRLYTGLDGRDVRHAFESSKRSTVYDTSAAMTAGEPAEVRVEVENGLPPAVDFNSVTCSTSALPAAIEGTRFPVAVPLRASSGYATTESKSYVDGFGNRTVALAKGCIAGVCPGVDANDSPEITGDETLCSFTKPGFPANQATGWLHRTVLSWGQGSVDTVQRGRTTIAYTPEGAPSTTQVKLTSSIPLARYTSYSGKPPAPDPTTASQEGPDDITVSEATYDGFGNVLRQKGANGRCRDVSYEASLGESYSYSQFPTQELTYVDGCPAPGAPAPDTVLTTTAFYDRGLGLVTSVTDMTLQTSFVRYDGFGRLTELFRARPDGAAIDLETAVPSVKIDYDLPAPGSGRAYSIIHTATQDGLSVDDAQYLESHSYVDGMGRARVGLAEADEVEDGEPYIVSSIAEFDAKGAVRRKYLPYFDNPDPASFPVSDAPPDVPYGRQRYDAFGRQLQTFDVDGTVTLQSRYHALSTDLYDAADLYPGPHQGSYASTRTDGHGRTVATTERVHVGGALEKREVRTKYLASGQPQIITRVRVGTSDKVVRWMAYDSLGRMTMNADPHATVDFPTTPSSDPTLKTWHYVYNDAGDLVGTSDARGCGQNFVYDGAGRLKAEDYSPCEKVHDIYVTPDLVTGARYEVFYEYDDTPTTIVAKPDLSGQPEYEDTSDNLKGRLKAVHDRGATTWFKYDARGRTTTTYRKVSYIDAPLTTIAGRYVDHWYHKDFSYDAADRSIEETTGVAEGSVLEATDGESRVKTNYTKRGTLKNVDSSYGMLVQGIQRSADGLVGQITFGDAAGTKTAMRYDTRRRLASVQTFRSEASLWSTPPPAITPVPGTSDATRQLLLQDLDYSYDVVNNPVEIRDWRTADEWPDGAKPSTRRMEYDDLYRVTRVDYEYPAGYDNFVSPWEPELNGQSDPRRAWPYGHKLLGKRPLWQTYNYDWLGNTTKTDDDQHAFYDRSIGNVSNGAGGSGGSVGKPYQMVAASQTAVPNNGSILNVAYDAAGNVASYRVSRSSTACTTSLTVCGQRFFYDWDEVGRLQFARRVEGEGPNATGPRLDFLYDANDERVVKQHYYNTLTGNTPDLSTLYVFDSLEIRRAPFDTTTLQYAVNADTEVAYLAANGMRLARLHYEPTTKGEPQLVTPSALHASNLHVMLNLPDHLGSSSLIIDHATGELVEARTYQPYGATESDYRPDRWKGFREDYGFTGKEEDVEVGLQYFGKRYLSPYLGRWISADPLAVHVPGRADLNLYAYVEGQVLRNVDPLGLVGGPPGTPENQGGEGAGPGPSAAPAATTPEPKKPDEVLLASPNTGARGQANDPNPPQPTPPVQPPEERPTYEATLGGAHGRPGTDDHARSSTDLKSTADAAVKLYVGVETGAAAGALVGAAYVGARTAAMPHILRAYLAKEEAAMPARFLRDEMAIARGAQADAVIAREAAAVAGPKAIDPNRLNHIFGKAEHALDDFVKASGGQEQAFARIQDAANRALSEGRLTVGKNGILPRGDAGNIIDVDGTQLRLIGGRAIDGVVEISSASRKGLP